jgi:hypothetical protein
LLPCVVEVSEHDPLPLLSVPVQEAAPSLTVTEPVGVVAGWVVFATLKPTVYAWPTTLGSGESLVIDVALAYLTLCDTLVTTAL